MQLSGISDTMDRLWNTKWILSASSGILLGFSYPPLDLPFLQIVAFILLFRLAALCNSYRAAAYWSYFSFLIWNLIVTYWMMMATVGGGIAAILANSVVMTIPFVLLRLVLRNWSNIPLQSVLLAAIWTGYEYLHHHWDLAWPWLSLGNGWANYPTLIQYISFTGYLGISFWVVLTASLLYFCITEINRTRILYISLLIGLLPPLTSSAYHIYSNPTPTGETSSVQLVVGQPDFDSYASNYGYSNPIRPLQVIMKLTDSLRSANTDAIIWPENAVQPYLSSQMTNNAYANRIRQMLQQNSEAWNIPIITGATYLEYYQADSQQTPSLVRNPDSERPYIYYNAAIAFRPDRTMKVYKKVHLVPLVERIPFLSFLHRINLFGIAWHTLPWYGKGDSYTQFKVNSTRTPALVCYDSVFPHWMRGFILDGAGFLTIITNDGWWGDTSGHMQHFAYARLRAIEFRRWVVRSANNGISGVISPTGKVVKRTRYGEQTGFTTQIPVRNKLTFFARYGGWLPIGCLILVLLCMGYLFIRNQFSLRSPFSSTE